MIPTANIAAVAGSSIATATSSSTAVDNATANSITDLHTYQRTIQ